MNEFKAVARYQRISPRRVRMVGQLIKGKTVDQAVRILAGVRHAGADLLSTVIRSAHANAVKMDEEKKLNVDTDRLVISTLQIGGGPMMKRFRPMSMGRAGRIRRRTTHVTVILKEKIGEEAGA